MNCVFFFLCVAVSIGTVFSAVSIQPQVKKPQEMKHLEGCYIPNLNRVLPYNKPFSPQDGKNCVQYVCRSNNMTFIYSCGAIADVAGYKLVPGDKSLPYPDCCDHQVTRN